MDLASRRKDYKKGVNADDARRSRTQVSQEIRKNNKMEAQMKRRNMGGPTPAEPAVAGTAPSTAIVGVAPADNTPLAVHAAGT
jgi:hypothetical protein